MTYSELSSFGGTIGSFGGRVQSILTTVNPFNNSWVVFNPALGKTSEGQLFCIFRVANFVKDNEQASGWRVLIDGYDYKNVLYYGNLSDKYEVSDLEELVIKGGPNLVRGLEDPRVFQREDGWYLLATYMEKWSEESRMIVYKLDLETKVATFVKLYNGHSLAVAEKNWMPTYDKANPNFDFIYSSTGIYKDDQIILSTTSNKNLNNLRGGAPLYPLNDGSYISICHIQDKDQKAKIFEDKVKLYDVCNYTHVFVRYNNYGKIIERSPEFVFEDYHVEFASGLIEHEGNFLITYGINDLTSSLAIIPKDNVLKMLFPVDEESSDWDE
jgi:predicted GH43/DUF377 family glycosyl hydrolase